MSRSRPQQPSPFARSLLFGYVAAFLYEGDSPLAERRAAALSLDPTLLAELLGRGRAARAARPEAVVDARARAAAARRRPPGARRRGRRRPAAAARSADHRRGRRATRRRDAGVAGRRSRTARRAIAGADRRRGALGGGRGRRPAARRARRARCRSACPTRSSSRSRDPLGDLVARYARTHGPFTAADVAARFGLGVAVVDRRAAAARRRRPGGRGRVPARRRRAREWCDAEVLRRCAAGRWPALRKEVEPVEPAALAGSCRPGSSVGQPAARRRRRAGGGRAAAGLRGAGLGLEPLVLPARVPDYSPAYARRAVRGRRGAVGAAHGSLPGNDGWVSLHLADARHLTLPDPAIAATPTPLHERVLDALAGGGAYFFRQLADAVGVDRRPGDCARRCGTWSGPGTSPTTRSPRCAPCSPAAAARTGPGVGAAAGSRLARPRPAGRDAEPHRAADRGRPLVAAARARDRPDPARATPSPRSLLERHGVVTRGAVMAERRARRVRRASTGCSAAFEETGRCRRGYFVEGLGAAQFALPGPVDRLRAIRRATRTAADAEVAAVRSGRHRPGQPLRRAALGLADDRRRGHRPGPQGRRARRAGRRATSSSTSSAAADHPASPGRRRARGRGAAALARRARGSARPAHGRAGRRRRGARPRKQPAGHAFESAGFHATPRGLRLRG